MSPSWRESLRIDLDAQSLRVGRWSAGWRPRLLGVVTRPLPQATAAAVGPALAEALATLPAKGLRADVMLGGPWVRLALLTEAGGVRGAAERQAAGAHALRRIHGNVAAAWRVTTCSAGPGTLLAAGADAALLDGVDQALRQAEARPARLQPSLVQAFEACTSLLRRPAWLVSLEPGQSTVAFADGRRLRVLNAHRLPQAAAADELPRWLAQARLLDGVGEAEAPLLIVHRGVAVAGLAARHPQARLVALDAAADGLAAA